MFDLDKEFRRFYSTCVVLPKHELMNLREKKHLNIERLKDGLMEYNDDHGTNYQIVDIVEQGSVAMSTVTQNENKDYDIDVAIIFDEDNIGDLTPIKIKNIIVKALKKKCTNFKIAPEAKTNCVRIVYADNYHIDFAIYKRKRNRNQTFIYEHAGSEWRERDPRDINRWYQEQIKLKSEKLRHATRLSKMFCKSRSDWKMPGGLIQSVLCSEAITSYKRMDEMFYYTIVNIRNRLLNDIDVFNPTNSKLSLLLTMKDEQKMTNLLNRLNDQIEKLQVLFQSTCTKEEAINTWKEFFSHQYWDDCLENCKRDLSLETDLNKSYALVETEDYIETLFPVISNCYYQLKVNCHVRYGGQSQTLRLMLNRGLKINKGSKLYFYIENDCSKYGSYEVYIKVKNNGIEALRANCLRGEINNFDVTEKYHNETASYTGEHLVEFYLIKNGQCVAMDNIKVPIA